jgi:GT2 family glycosyltransferase
VTGVTVLIATRNRKESLERVLAAAAKQSVVRQIICVDDASTDGTGHFIRERFPDVNIVQLMENVGPAAARDIGARHASGEFLAILDDDCVLRDPTSLEKAIGWMDRPRLAGVTLPFVNVLSDTTVRTAAPKPEGIFVTSDFYAGMVLFRREIFVELGGYRTIYFMHHEEPDLALRLLERGFLIRAGQSLLIDHYESPVRDKARLWRLGARNAILFSLLNVPNQYLWYHLPATILKTGYYGMRRGAINPVLKGFFEAASLGKEAWEQKLPVSGRTYQLFRKLRKSGPLKWEEVEAFLR